MGSLVMGGSCRWTVLLKGRGISSSTPPSWSLRRTAKWMEEGDILETVPIAEDQTGPSSNSIHPRHARFQRMFLRYRQSGPHLALLAT